MGIVKRIYDLCDQKGKTVYGLSKILDINQSTMSTWKKRDASIPSDYLEKIANYLGVTIEYLVTGKEQEPYRYTTEEEDEVLRMLRELPIPEKYIFIGRLTEAHSKAFPIDKHQDGNLKSSAMNGSVNTN